MFEDADDDTTEPVQLRPTVMFEIVHGANPAALRF